MRQWSIIVMSGCLATFMLALGGCATNRAQRQSRDNSVGSRVTAASPAARTRDVKKKSERTPTPTATPDSGDGTVGLPDSVASVAYQPSELENEKAEFSLPSPTSDSKKLKKVEVAELPGSAYNNSAESPDSPGITLNEVIGTCLFADPVIRAGLESINQANADALTASLLPNPELFTDVQLFTLTRPFTVTRQGGPPQQDFIASFPIDWFLFGKRAAAMRSTELAVRISEAEYADLIRVRVLEAATAYYDVLEAKALRDLARQDVENYSRVEAITTIAVANGGRPEVELNRIRLDRLKSQQGLRDAENALVATTARLRVLLGADEADPAFNVAGSLGQKLPFESLSAEEAMAIARENRPDIRALQARVVQAQAQIETEQRRGYPTVAPSLGYTRQYQEKAIGFPDADSYSAAVTMSINLFDRNQGNQAKAVAIMTQNQFGLRARMVALRAEIVQALKQLQTADANARAVTGEQLQLAEKVRDSLNEAYSIGGRPLIDVLDAQRNYRETYRLYIISHAAYGRAVVKLNATLGKQVAP